VNKTQFEKYGFDYFVDNVTRDFKTEKTSPGIGQYCKCNYKGENKTEFGKTTTITTQPGKCPSRAGIMFWENEALWQTKNIFDLGFSQPHWGMFAAYTAAWVLVYGCVFQGVASSGKIVYFTALFPYVVLVIFFFRAMTLPNALTGVKFYLSPDFSKLVEPSIWIDAVTQIFYSLGVGFGSLIAFASFSDAKDDFVGNAVKVSAINCGTSFFCGFTVFPVLGYLALEMSKVNPCFQKDNIQALGDIGISGSGLAFIAFPIAIDKMPASFIFAFLFFLMLLCLGIDSQFAMVESVITVLNDAGIGKNVSKPVFAAIVCGVSWFIGLPFITRGGIYWFNMFNNYTCVVALFGVCFFELVGVMWLNASTWQTFKSKFEECLEYPVPKVLIAVWSMIPFLLVGLFVMAFTTPELLKGDEYEPATSSNAIGWAVGLLPLVGAIAFLIYDLRKGEARALDLPVQDPEHDLHARASEGSIELRR